MQESGGEDGVRAGGPVTPGKDADELGGSARAVVWVSVPSEDSEALPQYRRASMRRPRGRGGAGRRTAGEAGWWWIRNEGGGGGAELL